jgi:hypothetical protein
VLTAREIYTTNFFPEMNVSWRTYPDNIGHKIFAGCFRCHDGRHVDAGGRALSHECGTCHEFLSPTAEDQAATKLVGIGGFKHPIELEGIHATLRCDSCHTGGVAPQPTCAGCHSDVAGFRAGTLAAFKPFNLPAEPMAETVDCKDCHDLSKPKTVAEIDPKCMDCHSDEEERFGGMLKSWKSETDRMLQSAEAAHATASPAAQQALAALRKAGPLHNMEATRKLIATLFPNVATAQH